MTMAGRIAIMNRGKVCTDRRAGRKFTSTQLPATARSADGGSVNVPEGLRKSAVKMARALASSGLTQYPLKVDPGRLRRR